MKNNLVEINGYKVKCTYAGIEEFTVYKDGKDIGTCWAITDVAKMTETDAETVKEEMWEQRYVRKSQKQS